MLVQFASIASPIQQVWFVRLARRILRAKSKTFEHWFTRLRKPKVWRTFERIYKEFILTVVVKDGPLTWEHVGFPLTYGDYCTTVSKWFGNLLSNRRCTTVSLRYSMEKIVNIEIDGPLGLKHYCPFPKTEWASGEQSKSHFLLVWRRLILPFLGCWKFAHRVGAIRKNCVLQLSSAHHHSVARRLPAERTENLGQSLYKVFYNC